MDWLAKQEAVIAEKSREGLFVFN